MEKGRRSRSRFRCEAEADQRIMRAFDLLAGVYAGALLLFFIFSIIFLFVAKGRWPLRFLPIAHFCCWFLIDFLPETGWSDVRSQWFHSAALIPYSFLFFGMAAWLRRSGFTFYKMFALVSFLAGASMFALAVFYLDRSWFFYHEFVP